jgi:molybdenum-dependent DNA-binding transcriptional regulator ModE
MNRIEDYQAFTAIIEKRSLTAAARHLGRSLQSVSRSLAALEHEVGVELIRRTTRRSNPTDAGLAFYRRLSAALAEIEAAKLETSNRRAEATGLLRIAGSTGFISFRRYRNFLQPIPESKSNSNYPIVLSISSVKATTSQFELESCRTRHSRPGDWQIRGASFLPLQAISPSMVGPEVRRTSCVTNASSAPLPAIAMLGRST